MSVPEHLTAVARNARVLATRGDLRGAQAMLDQALEPAGAVLGPDHPEVIAATRLLASLHRDLGDLADARKLLEEALAAGQFALGEDSAALLPLSYDLATLADELGNRHEARRNFTRLLRHGPAALGADHEYVRAARRYLGVAAPQPAAPPAAQPAADAPPPPVDLTPAVDLTPTARIPAVRPVVTPPPVFTPAAPPVSTRSASPPPVSVPAFPVSSRTASSWSVRDSEHRLDEHRHSRAPLLALVLVAAMALVGGGIAAYLVLRSPGRAPGPRTTPTAVEDRFRPPGDLALRDDGSSVTLTWTDPSGGTAPFVVAGGRANKEAPLLGKVAAGTTTYTLSGTVPNVDYCFVVAAVYSPDRTVTSRLTCTRRGAASASPSPRR